MQSYEDYVAAMAKAVDSQLCNLGSSTNENSEPRHFKIGQNCSTAPAISHKWPGSSIPTPSCNTLEYVL